MNAVTARHIEDAAMDEVDELDALRAYGYALLARLLHRAPDRELLRILAGMKGDDTPLGRAHTELAEAAGRADPNRVEREHFALFVGVGRGELLPYASFYMTGFLNERPLADVRRDFAALGAERAEGLYDPEDHIAILFDVMAGLSRGQFVDAKLGELAFFTRHIEPWAMRFFEDLAIAPSSDFYKSVAALGSAFLTVESSAFALEAE